MGDKMSYEVELISALRSKDKDKIEQVFKNIYEAYFKLVYFCVGNYLDNKEDIEDITSEVFVNFFNHLESINIGGSIKYYLTKSAKNMSLNFLKKQNREVKEFDLDNYAKYEMPSNDLLYFIKLNLDELEKDIVIAHVLEGYSLRTIAKEKGMNINTIKSKYRRALFKLKYLLKGENLWKRRI